MSTSATRANGVQVTSLVSCPVVSGAGGLWWDGNTTGPKWRKADGTDVTLGAGGGGSTGNWTFSGNIADLSGAGAMQLGSANATSIKLIPATLNFPSAMSMTATAAGATNTTGLTLAPNVADGASSIGLAINTGTALSTAGAKLLTISNNGSEKFKVDLNGYVQPGSGVTASSLPSAGYTAPTLLNSWVNFGAPYAGAGYMKDAMGFVHLRGLVKSGTITTTIFTLPAGYRPANSIYLGIESANAFGTLQVDNAGNVTCQQGTNTSVQLDCVFLAEA